MTKQSVAAIAKAIVAPGKGLLAMDESNRTCNKRFADVGIALTEENRRAYRELILTAPGLGPRSAARFYTMKRSIKPQKTELHLSRY
jgi:fructose-bisphosphate aldolase class 1